MKLTGTITRSGAFPGTVKEKKTVLGQLGMNPSSIPVVVDHELSLSSTNPVQNRVITAAITNRLLSDEVKDALLQIVEKVAYIDADGQDYYDALYDALYPPVGLDSIGAVFDSSATIYTTDTLDDLKQYLTVTAFYSDGTSETVTTYTLSGSMDAGTQTITVSYGGETTTFAVTVVEWLVSIDAVFTQGSAVIYDTDSLDTLRQYLAVTATYGDSTTATVSDYTLSGTLEEGTSTITASYGGKTDTFTVTVTAASVISSITAVFSTGADTPIDISSASVINSWINTGGAWATESTSSAICIPVTVGKRYSFSWSETDSTVVGTIFKYGFSDTSTPSGQILTHWAKSSPQIAQAANSAVADKQYLVIQLGTAYINNILSNGYLSVTESADGINTNSSLDDLRQYLTVTATYSDSTTAVVTDYTLSGTLAEGTSTITVSYGGKSDTVNVPCKVGGWLYRFEQSLASSGSEDFGFLGNCSYDTGRDGTGYSMYNDTEAAYASGNTTPDFSGDFTVSFWAKTLVAKNGQGLNAYIGSSSSSSLSSLGTATSIKSGWSVSSNNVNKSNDGCRFASWSSSKISVRLVNAATTAGRNFECTVPSSFDSMTWHHYALTRKDGTIRFFVDGEVIFTVSTSAALRFPSQCALGGYYDTSNTMLTSTSNKSWYDDLFVAEYCKWDSEFDPQSISY